jgi:uroporphyrinogen-III synthase
MDHADNLPLAGCGVVVTRPAHQAQHLMDLIAQAGGKPFLFPVLEIVEARDLAPFNNLVERLEQFDIAIFISPNAVSKAMNLIRARRGLPEHLMIAAIGKGSSRELSRLGVPDVVAPADNADSEALLTLPQMQQVAGKKIVIFRGEGGRELLGNELTARGAHIEYAECYRRHRPDSDARDLLYHWARNELDAIIVTSGEGLHNLYDMVGKLGRQWLKKTPVFVPHERLVEVAHSLGMAEVYGTGPGDEGLLEGVIEWYRNRKTAVKS